jgi:RNA polymerase primary sigma factor
MDERKVERAVDALLDDYYRQGERLDLVQIERTLDRRKLQPDETLEVWRELQQRGVTPEDEQPRGFVARRWPRASSTWGSSPDLVRQYLREIGRIRLLTAKDEVELGRRISLGQKARARLDDELNGLVTLEGAERRTLAQTATRGREAWQQMVSANLRLVVSISKRYIGRSARLELLDLIQEGTFGLFRAAEKYDHTMGFKFSTYATWWIRQSIERALADKGRLIRIPVRTSETITRINAISRRLSGELGRVPTLRQIAERADLAPEYVSFLLDVSREPASLDAPVVREDDEGNELIEFIDEASFEDPADVAERRARDAAIEAILTELNDRERRIIELRFGLTDRAAMTLEEVGQEYGVTRERIRQIQTKSLAKLRHPTRSSSLRDFVDFRIASTNESNGPEDGDGGAQQGEEMADADKCER